MGRKRDEAKLHKKKKKTRSLKQSSSQTETDAQPQDPDEHILNSYLRNRQNLFFLKSPPLKFTPIC